MRDRQLDRFSSPLNPDDLVIFPARFDCFGAGKIVDESNIPGFVTVRPLDRKDTLTVQARNCVKVGDDR